MIRPSTAISCALAIGAVLYTYQSKHEVQVLDRQIERTLADTAKLRDDSRNLRGEWSRREDPERLRAFADQFLSLRPVAPTQFATLTDLDTRLPAPRAMSPATGTTDTTVEPAEAPVAAAPSADATAVAEAEELPIPPLPVPPPVALATNTSLAAPKPAPPRPPVVAAAPSVQAAPPATPPSLVQLSPARQPVVQAPPIQAQAVQAPPMQAQPARMPPVQAPPMQARAQPAPMPQQPMQTGSLLGFGRGGYAPAPRPIPISTTQFGN